VIEASEVQGWLGKLMNNHAFLMTKAVDPDVGVVTNVAIDHIGLVNSIEEVFEETSGVAKALKKGTLVLNYDDENVIRMIEFTRNNINPFYFSIDSQTSSHNCLTYDDNQKAIIYKSEPILTIEELPFNSNHFIQNTLAAISVCLSLGIKLADIIEGVKSYKSLKRRFRKINHNPMIIDDFAHNPEGIKATVNAVANLSNENLKIICAIRGSRGNELNEINAEALAEIIKSINYKSIDFSESNIINEKEKNTKIELILSSSSDVVDEANFVEEFEEETFFDVLNKKGIEYVHYKNLHDALFDAYNSAKVDDVILLIGAQGMDPAEDLLNDIIDNES
jgi:UDP-N-acetylmuramyl tripeptide synthase